MGGRDDEVGWWRREAVQLGVDGVKEEDSDALGDSAGRREQESEHLMDEAEVKLEDVAPRLKLTQATGMAWRGGVA